MSKKKHNLLIKIIGTMLIVLLACSSLLFVGKRKLDTLQTSMNELQTEFTNNKRVVYVAKRDIVAGESLISESYDNSNIMEQQIYSGLEESYYFLESESGVVAKTNITAGEPIMLNMTTPYIITDDEREVEISVASLMLDQRNYDVIDVRIQFPTGENYTVLSKKPINKMVMDAQTFYTCLNEEEILRLSSATIDAYTITGTKIYTTRYIEENIQKENVPDYPVRESTTDLLTINPNTLSLATHTINREIRHSLENRLIGISSEQLAAVSSGLGLVDTAKQQVLLQENENMFLPDGETYGRINGEDNKQELVPEINNTDKVNENSESTTNNSTTSENINK